MMSTEVGQKVQVFDWRNKHLAFSATLTTPLSNVTNPLSSAVTEAFIGNPVLDINWSVRFNFNTGLCFLYTYSNKCSQFSVL